MFSAKNVRVYAKVWKVDAFEKYAKVRLGTSRKDKNSGEYKNSNWFTTFLGENAMKNIMELNEGDKIVITSFSFALEPYEKDGETVYPKTPAVNIYAWEFNDEQAQQAAHGGMDTPPAVDDNNDDDIPF